MIIGLASLFFSINIVFHPNKTIEKSIKGTYKEADYFANSKLAVVCIIFAGFIGIAWAIVCIYSAVTGDIRFVVK